MTLRYLSLFSGIEAATVAWTPLGFEAVAYAEVDKYANQLLAEKYPNTPNLGDVTKITEAQVRALGSIDLVIFGSPCQDLSVAGGQKGLDGGRSGLFRTAIRVIQWARKHCKLRFALWENVPGAFSTNKGEDFAEVVSSLAGLENVSPPENGWGKEGAALGDNGLLEWAVLDAQWFGLAQRRKRLFAVVDFGNWPSRPPILLERESMRGNHPTRPASWEGNPGSAHDDFRASNPLRSRTESFRMLGYGHYAYDQIAGTLKARDHKDATDLICESFCIQANTIDRSIDTGANGAGINKEHAFTLSTVDRHAVAYTNIRSGSTVRRLTPLECERLQGFPDNYTAALSNTQRYKVLGNSMAVPVIRWIGKSIIKSME